jgi:hypothetical protein
VHAAAEEIRAIARVRQIQLTISPPVAKAASNRAASLVTISMPKSILQARSLSCSSRRTALPPAQDRGGRPCHNDNVTPMEPTPDHCICVSKVLAFRALYAWFAHGSGPGLVAFDPVRASRQGSRRALANVRIQGPPACTQRNLKRSSPCGSSEDTNAGRLVRPGSRRRTRRAQAGFRS